MGVANYLTFDGELLGENRAGIEVDYLSDPLGSVVALTDNSGSVTVNRTYWPYGEVNAQVGSWLPPFGYIGAGGYYKDSWGGIYVRARSFRPELARWQSTDKFWPLERVYTYVHCNPVVFTDSSGLSPGSDLLNCIHALERLGYSGSSACERCKATLGYHGCFRCDSQSTSGRPVPPLTGTKRPPSQFPRPPVPVGPISPEFPWGGQMDPGESLCEAACSDSKPDSILAKAQKKWCVKMCQKIRQGGCTYLEGYCDTLCSGGQKYPCESCLAFYVASGCPGNIPSGSD